MISDFEIEREFSAALEYYRQYFSGKDRGDIASFFMADEDTFGSFWVEKGESLLEQKCLHLARIRAIAQVLEEHPAAKEFSNDIAALSAIGASKETELRIKANLALQEFWALIKDPRS